MNSTNPSSTHDYEKDPPAVAQKASKIEDDPLQPELTLRSGLAALGATLAYFCTVGFLNAFGIFQEYYTSTLLSTKSQFQVSWLGSIAFFTVFFFAPAAGILADKIGPQLPVASGSACLLLAVFMISLCKEYWQFMLAQGVLLGIGMSFVTIPASGVVPRYFRRNKGLATGMSVAGSSLGGKSLFSSIKGFSDNADKSPPLTGIIWPIFFNELLNKHHVSFAWSVRIAGFIMLPICIFCIFTIKQPLQPPIPTAECEEGTGDQAKQAKSKKDFSGLRAPPFILLCLGLFFGLLGFFVPNFYVSVYATQEGVSARLSFYFISVINAASFFGRVIPGFFADRLGRFNMLVVSLFSAALIAFCWTTANTVAGLVVWTAAYGFASGALLSLQLACATTLVSEDIAGAAVGTAMGSSSLATLFGAPIGGELVKHGYIALACFSGASLLAGGVCIVIARMLLSRQFSARV